MLALLRHPHIVPYKEFFKDDGDLCLVMAHCEGGDLYHYVRQKRSVHLHAPMQRPLPCNADHACDSFTAFIPRKSGQKIEEELAWQWLVQLLLSLSYCHSKKILHRDVKTQVSGWSWLGLYSLARCQPFGPQALFAFT